MSTILRSIAGRIFGYDKDGYATSPNGAKLPDLKIGVSNSEVSTFAAQTSNASSTGTAITAGGVTAMASTAGANLTYSLSAPVAGVPKAIIQTGASTGNIILAASGVTFRSTGGSTFNSIVMTLAGGAIDLFGISTSVYGVVGIQSTGVALSTG